LRKADGRRMESATLRRSERSTTAGSSTFEHRPADLVAQPLVVEDEVADRIRELFALPPALESSGARSLVRGSGRTRCLDRIGRSTELVCGDMRHHRGLASSERCVTSRSTQHSSRSHRMAARRAGLGHPDLALRPCPNLFDRLPGPRVRRLHRLVEVQNVLCARGRPQREEPMVGVRECPPAADGDEPGVANLGQDHGSTVRPCCTSSRRRLGANSRMARHSSRPTLSRRFGAPWHPDLCALGTGRAAPDQGNLSECSGVE
jgi:hypothetical protein